MHELRISVSTKCFEQPIKQSVRTAAECGTKAIQIDAREELPPELLTDTGRRQFLHQLDEMGLRVAALTFPMRHTLYENNQLDGRVAAIKQAMKFTGQLKASILTARIGRIPVDKESKDSQLLFEVLSDLAQYGNHVGVTLSIAPMNDAPKTLLELFNSIKTGLVGLDFDPAAFILGGHQPVQALRDLYTFIMHFSVRDAVRDIDGSGIEVAVGRGEVDWIELLPLLGEIEYKGWVNVDRTQGIDRGGDAMRAIQFLKQIYFQ